jgi:hypothetical protein
MSATYRDPGHCITRFASVKDGKTAPDAVWTFTVREDAVAWREYLRGENPDMVVGLHSRTLRVEGVAVEMFCLVLS